jgi:hypothetical protein
VANARHATPQLPTGARLEKGHELCIVSLYIHAAIGNAPRRGAVRGIAAAGKGPARAMRRTGRVAAGDRHPYSAPPALAERTQST